MLEVILVISMLATVAPAAVKRDDFSSSGSSSPSASGSSSGSSQPVYSPSAPASSGYGASSSGSPQFGGQSGYVSRSESPSYGSGQQYPADQHAAASSGSASYQAQQANPGNLYYYYYPVQDKPKDTNYQASPSNTYSSAVNPNFGSSSSGVSQIGSQDSAQHSGLDSAASGQDLSYSAQDLSYSAQSLGQGIGQGMSQGIGQGISQGLGQSISDYGSQSGASYNDQLSNLASQLQQYGFGSGSAPGSFGQSASAYGAAPTGYGSQTGYDASAAYGAAGSQGAGSYASADSSAAYAQGAVPSYGAAAGSYQQAGSPGSSPYGPQSSAYPYGAAGQHYGSYAAGSSQHASYEPTSSGYRRYGLGSILMPMLALAGLSLLIPSVTSLGAAGRKKRSVDDSAKESATGSYIDRLERYYSIYRTAVEKEECMNRIICELGDAMSGVRGKSAFVTVLEKFVPQWMGNKVGVFKASALSGEYGKCKKYTC